MLSVRLSVAPCALFWVVLSLFLAFQVDRRRDDSDQQLGLPGGAGDPWQSLGCGQRCWHLGYVRVCCSPTPNGGAEGIFVPEQQPHFWKVVSPVRNWDWSQLWGWQTCVYTGGLHPPGRCCRAETLLQGAETFWSEQRDVILPPGSGRRKCTRTAVTQLQLAETSKCLGSVLFLSVIFLMRPNHSALVKQEPGERILQHGEVPC